MELSLEEAIDLFLELLGCGAVVVIFQVFSKSDAILQLIGRVIH